MTRKHAILSASSAHRWLVCTPSARLEENIEEQQSTYAEEGEIAHAKAEEKLKKYLETGLLEECEDEYIQAYLNFVVERIQANNNPKVFIEQQVTFEKYVPEGFGTADVLIIADKKIELIDLKYGRGIKVHARNNPQLRLYALGALEMFSGIYDVEAVKMAIVQPRLDWIEEEEISVYELIEWGEKYVKPRAQLAFEGKGEFVPGEHCRFCKLKATCRARTEYMFELEKYNFAPPDTLTIDELKEVISKIDQLVDWAESVKTYAIGQILSGKHIPGWKVVEGRSQRKITNEAAAIETLRAAGFKEVTKVVLKPLGELEKIVGRKKLPEVLGPLLVKPPGKPTLVPADDPRPEYDAKVYFD